MMVPRVLNVMLLAYVTLIVSSVIDSLTVDPATSGNATRLSLLKKMLQTGDYDSRVPPEYEQNIPTNVTIRIELLSFDSVSETKMDYSVELFLTQEWVDGRLHFANRTDSKWLEVDSKMMNEVWVPDVYFRNEKSGYFHDVTVPNKFMHLYPEGKVIYSVRLSLTLNCRMNLIKYPLDTQECPMWIQSYTYTTENVMFFWHSDSPVAYDQEMDIHTELPQFSIVNKSAESCQTLKNGDDDPTFACIVARFTLQRDIRYYIIQIYVPSILIVALSWVSFWLDLEAIPARVSLGVLTVLTMNTHGSTVQAALPKVSYIKAIDVWVVSSLIFVFAALLEFAYVNVLARRADKEMAMAEVLARSQLSGTNFQANGGSGTPHMLVRKRETGTLEECEALNDHTLSQDRLTRHSQMDAAAQGKDAEVKDSSSAGSYSPAAVNAEMSRHIMLDGSLPSRCRARRVDKISRIVFPVCFTIFNAIYWAVYINLGDEFSSRRPKT